MMEISPAQVCSCTNTCSTNKHAAAGCHKVCLLQSEQSWRLKKKSTNGKSPHCLGSEWFFFLDRKAVNVSKKWNTKSEK